MVGNILIFIAELIIKALLLHYLRLLRLVVDVVGSPLSPGKHQVVMFTDQTPQPLYSPSTTNSTSPSR